MFVDVMKVKRTHEHTSHILTLGYEAVKDSTFLYHCVSDLCLVTSTKEQVEDMEMTCITTRKTLAGNIKAHDLGSILVS